MFNLGTRKIGKGFMPFIIAEVSANHGGNIERAKNTILAAKKSGADAVKIQTYTPETMTLNSNKDDIINPEDVEDIIGFSKEYNFFELTKVIGKNNYIKSLEIVSYMSKNIKKYPLPLIIGTVYSFFNKLFIYHSIENKNEAPKLLGINPYTRGW